MNPALAAVTRAFTVRQPWASLIADGIKPTENRGSNVRHRGAVAIHAAIRIDRYAGHDVRVVAHYGLDPAAGRPLGVIVAVGTLTDCHPAAYGGPGRTCCEPWGDCRYNGGPCFHITLADVVKLPTPVPARGSLTLPWSMPDAVAEQVRAQLAGAVTC